jgi:hypothetical protein
VFKAVRFLSVVVKMGSKRELFQDQGTLESFAQKIVLPNMQLRRECAGVLSGDVMCVPIFNTRWCLPSQLSKKSSLRMIPWNTYDETWRQRVRLTLSYLDLLDSGH